MTQPVERLRDGAVKATIWKNQAENGPFFTVQVTRTYKDANDEYQDGHSFVGDEILRAERLFRIAYDRIKDLQSKLQE